MLYRSKSAEKLLCEFIILRKFENWTHENQNRNVYPYTNTSLLTILTSITRTCANGDRFIRFKYPPPFKYPLRLRAILTI